MNETSFGFRLLASSGQARRGVVTTGRGEIQTPAFMPVGTQATVKAMLPENVASTGAEIILSNAYHLMLRPGAERIAGLGGLHEFMNWPGPILTDSGGYQVMSLSRLRKMSEEGVEFRSHIDGSRHMMSPERSIQVQHLLGSDITMCFDECTPYPVDEMTAEQSMKQSMRWSERSSAAFIDRPGHALFGIQQGSVFRELRQASSEYLTGIGFSGYAIGGLAVGEPQHVMLEVLDHAAAGLPWEKPRYLMGVGTPHDILEAVKRGVDMFDCVLPSRSGRNGQVFLRNGKLNIKNSRHATDPEPLSDTCCCPACQSYSRAYLHHAYKANEIICSMLLTWHNLQFYQDFMREIRVAIREGTLDSIKIGG